jgi:hypothetical protein
MARKVLWDLFASLQNGGVILKGNEIIGIIFRNKEFTQAVNRPETSGDQHKSDSTPPYIFIFTSVPISGLPVVGNDRVIHIFARGFKFDPHGNNYVTVVIDGQVIDQSALNISSPLIFEIAYTILR